MIYFKFFLSIFLLIPFVLITLQSQTIPIVLPSYNPYYKKVLSGFQKQFSYPSRIYYLSTQTEKQQELQDILSDIKQNSPPFIIAIGEEASILMQNSVSDIPIVFTMVHNAKLLNIQNHNFCGIETDSYLLEYYKVLKKTNNKASNIFSIYSTDKSKVILDKISSEDIYNGVILKTVKVDDRESFSKILTELPKEIDAFLMINDPIYNEETFRELSDYCKKNQVQLFVPYPSLVDLGASLTLIPDYKRLGVHTAEFSNALMAQKFQCSIGPIQKFHNYLLYINENYYVQSGMKLPESLQKRTQSDKVLMVGIELFDRGMYRSSAKVLEKLLEEEPDNELVNYYLQQIIFEQTKEQIALLMKKGNSFLSKGDYEKARKIYKEVLKLNPNYKDAEVKYDETLLKENERYISEATSLDKNGNSFQAILKLKSAIRLYPSNDKAKTLLSSIIKKELKNIPGYIEDGISHYIKRKYEYSIKIMENILLIDPKNKTANEYLRLSKVKLEAYKRLEKCAEGRSQSDDCLLLNR